MKLVSASSVLPRRSSSLIPCCDNIATCQVGSMLTRSNCATNAFSCTAQAVYGANLRHPICGAKGKTSKMSCRYRWKVGVSCRNFWYRFPDLNYDTFCLLYVLKFSTWPRLLISTIQFFLAAFRRHSSVLGGFYRWRLL